MNYFYSPRFYNIRRNEKQEVIFTPLFDPLPLSRSSAFRCDRWIRDPSLRETINAAYRTILFEMRPTRTLSYCG